MRIYFEDHVRYGIPLNEYYLPGKKHKGLVIVCHRLNASKDSGPGLIPKKLAEAGYFVVSIDSYKHGLRKQEPFISGQERQKLAAMVEVINQTALDVKFLYDNHYQAKFPTLSVFGIGMGGMIAYQIPRLMTNIDRIVAIQATPYLKSMYHEKELKHIYKNLDQQEREVMDEYLEKLNLCDAMEQYKDIRIFAINHQEDLIIRPDNAQKFIQHLKLIGNHDAEFVLSVIGPDQIMGMAEEAIKWFDQPASPESI